MDVIVQKFKNYLLLRDADDIDKKVEDFRKLITNQYQRDTIYDEIGDFYILFCNTNRWTAFARYIQARYRIDSYKKTLDIGCGKMADTSLELIKRGYDVVSIDPKVKGKDGLKTINDYFDYLKTDVSDYDLLVGFEPCDATEHIIRSGLNNNKEFVIVLCYAPHNYIDGKTFKNYQMWHSYLLSISDQLILEQPEILNKTMSIIKRKG